MSVLREYAIAAYFAYFRKVRISHIFPHEFAFSCGVDVLLRLAGGRYSISSEEGLRIRNISQADDGEYTCRAEVRDAGRYDEKRITVAVHSQCSQTFRFRVRLFALVTHTHTHTANSSSITDRDYITRISGKSGPKDQVALHYYYTSPSHWCTTYEVSKL